MWSKSPSWPGAAPAAAARPEGLFRYSGLGYCTFAEAEKQEVFSSQAYQFLTRLYKEYSLEESPQLFLVRLQLDLVMGEWIAGQKIQ